MNIKTTEELSDFCREKLKKSGLTHAEIAEKIGKHESYISKAVALREKSKTSRNGIRREILNYLGFEVYTVFLVTRQNKS